jgi:DNA processing protein
MDDRRTAAWLALAHAPGLHVGQLSEWLSQGHSPLELREAPPQELAATSIEESVLAACRAPDPARNAADLAWLAGGPDRQLVTWGDGAYPPLLAQIPDAPLVLYVHGSVEALSLPQLAIVGSRNPTSFGRDTARQFAAHLARGGFTITSGLALGIDAAAHRGALEGGGRTVAVVGRGLDDVYPAENVELAARIVDGGGALVTDLPIGTPPLRYNFPWRNRILSGLAVGTLVVEAAVRSGSLITARLAAEQGREVFAIPGSIHNPLTRGCHKLLRQGARLVEAADDICSELGAIVGYLSDSLSPNAVVTPPHAGPLLDKEYKILLDALGFDPAGLDELVARTDLKTDAVASMLLMLELDGQVQQQPGGRFSRTVPGKV